MRAVTHGATAGPIDGSRGCLVLSGVPGAGKSTVAGLVADALPRSAVVAADAVAMMVRSGWVGPVDEPAEEARTQLVLRARNVCLLAGSFSEAGFFPVVDHVVADAVMAEAMVQWLTPAPVWFVTLAPDLATAGRRNTRRPSTEQVDDDVSGLHATIAGELSALGWHFDTTHLDAESTARAILAEAPRRAQVSSKNRP